MPDKTSSCKMIYRTLGSTGEKVLAIGVGGWHLGLKYVDYKLSVRIVRTALDRGINFLDNCWDYNNGLSEIRMGKALRDGYRQLMERHTGNVARAVRGEIVMVLAPAGRPKRETELSQKLDSP